jgi:hypothetical protein
VEYTLAPCPNFRDHLSQPGGSYGPFSVSDVEVVGIHQDKMRAKAYVYVTFGDPVPGKKSERICRPGHKQARKFTLERLNDNRWIFVDFYTYLKKP